MKYASALLTKLNTAEFFIDALTEWVPFLICALKLTSSAIDRLCSFWIVIADYANTFLNLGAAMCHLIKFIIIDYYNTYLSQWQLSSHLLLWDTFYLNHSLL